jgi:TPR repeat protein
MRKGLQRLSLGLALGVSLLVLAGCASSPSVPGSPERFEQGREAYMAGDYSRAFELLLREAEDGNPDAQYTVGYMYYEGQGVQQDEQAALRWIQTAANNGNRRAIQALGQMAGMGSRIGDTPSPEAESAD